MAGKSVKERLEDKKKRQNTLIVGAAGFVAVIVILAAGFILLGGSPGGDPAAFNQSRLDAGGLNVLIPLSDIVDEGFHFYSLDSAGTEVKYFVVKDKSGTVHTAFDACDVCFKSKKGYRQDGDNAKCNNCGKVFAVAGIGTKNTGGGCWPGYLPHEVQGDNIVIKRSDLDGGKHYF